MTLTTDFYFSHFVTNGLQLVSASIWT